MANTSPKKLTLRAFKISNPNLTTQDSGILELLQRALELKSTASSRRMPLNAEDPDRDLLANYTWGPNNVYLFGMMLRIIPAESGGIIDEALFEQPTITMAQIDAGSPEQSQYKGHFYFAINNNFLITNLSSNINVDRIQTYINWLLENVRGERLFQFAELTKTPEGLKLSQIRDIQFVGGGNAISSMPVPNERSTCLTYFSQLTSSILEQIISDTPSLEKIRESQLIEAKLLLKVKGKPKEMGKEEFQRIMSAIVTNVTNDNGIVVHTKDNNKYTGADIKVKKSIIVESSGTNRIVEEQLKQEMELFLGEIRTIQNG